MRLIDADALIHTHESEVAAIGKDWTVDDLATAIEVAPTIDAIPMWWISEKFLDVLNNDKELSKAVWLVRKAWQKEQEAQNG